jgi:glycosyltransferase involved in cell wall biosynthesis
MKVFFCETFDDGTVGGSHACMYNLIRHMDRSEFMFTVGFLSDNAYAQRYSDLGVQVEILPAGQPLKRGNIFFRKIRNWYVLDYRFVRNLTALFKMRQFDLIVLNNSIYASLPYVKAARAARIPVIVYERGIAYFYRRHIRASKRIQASIPVSEAVLEYLNSYNYKAPVIKRIYDGLDPLDYELHVDAGEVRRSLNIPGHGRLMGTVGNVRPWKGQKYFVDAFVTLAAKYPDLYGVIVGGWGKEDEAFQQDLAASVRHQGLGARLLFLGYRRDIARLLSAFDVFVHASTKPEPFGMVILEAMAAKKPIVATGIGGPLEILSNGECGILVPPKESKAIAQAGEVYLTNAAFRDRMVEAAYARLLSEFHINTTVKKTSDLFTRISRSASR